MEIHEHARRGDIVGVKRELDSKVPVDVRDPQTDSTPLVEAARSPDGTPELLQLLLERGADPNTVCGTKRGDSVLLLAVKTRDLKRLTILLDAGADIAFRSKAGYDVLVSCLYSEGVRDDPTLLDTVAFLIKRGAPLGGMSKFGESALNVASRLGRFDVVKLLLESGVEPDELRWTKLHQAVALGSLTEVQSSLAPGAELEARDCWDRTAWLLSLRVGDLEKVKLLASAGADRGARSRGGKHAFVHAIEGGHRHVVDWLIAEGIDVDQTDDSQTTALMEAAQEGDHVIAERLLSAGADPGLGDRTAMSMAATVEVVRVLQAAGADMADLPDRMRQVLSRVETGALEGTTSRAAFDEGRGRRFGGENPERMDVPFWKAMVAARAHAWTARRLFVPDEKPQEPVWCFSRYGQSFTELGDGRVVEIGGEHEDHYDPDFCIYNDVVVYDGRGGFAIYGYPRDLFPPTDFHTATLVEEWIYLIGSLSYPQERRHGHAQVFRLSVDDFHLERLETHGDDPGWISGHKARFRAPSSIHVSRGKVSTPGAYVANEQSFLFDLHTRAWSRLPDGS